MVYTGGALNSGAAGPAATGLSGSPMAISGISASAM
jgi:hypothetical protein